MRVPETDNPHFQYAFKTGYRLAIGGKSVNSMPSDIRRDMELRQYFQEGWEQAVEDVTLAQEESAKPDWKHRFIWFAVMVVGGLATAGLMISNIEKEQAEQQALIYGENNQPESISSQLGNPSDKLPENKLTGHLQGLSILTDAQRRDLQQTQQKEQKQPIPLATVVSSNIKISQASISKNVIDRQPLETFTDSVPKYIRELYFYTQIENANGQKIYHRWRTDKEILATIELNIKSDKFRTWSSKKLSSAWQGKWYLEVLNNHKEVVYRTEFVYGSSN